MTQGGSIPWRRSQREGLPYLLGLCERWEGRTPKEERPILHDDVGRWTRHCTPLTFWIIEGGGDSLLAPLRAGESQEAARCLPRRAAYGGRRRQGLRLRRSVSRPISCSTTDFPTRMLLTCEGGALRFDSLRVQFGSDWIREHSAFSIQVSEQSAGCSTPSTSYFTREDQELALR